MAKLDFPPPPGWSRRRLAALMGIPVIWFALGNGAILKLMDVFSSGDWGAFWVFWCGGAMPAQLGLLAIWGALGPGKGWRRILLCMAVGAFWILAWAGGRFLPMDRNFNFNRAEFSPALCLPLVLIAAQLPLWALRVFARWRLVQEDGAAFSPPPQMSIAGILVATTVVGATLASARFGAHLWDASSSSSWWLGLGIACAAAAGLSLTLLAPVCYLGLRMRPAPLGLLLSLLFLLLVIAVAATMAYWNMGAPGRPFGSYLAIPSVSAGFVVSLLAPLALLRMFDFRLRWGRE
jgi:hypothetical protein